MKILIVSLPRTGSTSLMNKISKEKNLNIISEPFDGRKNEIKIFPNDIVVKSIIKQHPYNIGNIVDWYYNFSLQFDELILLSRKDLKACWESLSYFTHNEKYGFSSASEYYWQETPNIDYYKNYILECNDIINSLSKVTSIGIQYYEDLFDISSTKRLRKGDKKDLKINKLM